MKRFLALLAFLWLLPTQSFAQQWLPGGAGQPIVCAFNTSPPTIGSGNYIYAQCDTNGKLITSGGGGSSSAITVSHANSTSLVNALSVKTAAGSLLGYNCTGITGASAGFCIAYNATAAPATGPLSGALVLDFCWFDTTSRGCSLGRAPTQVSYSAGIQILVTSATSPYTYTTGVDTAAISADFN